MSAAKKFSYRWTDRAIRLLKEVERLEAPQKIQQAAFDAVQHFVWASDCRRQAYDTTYCETRTPGWGAKADKAHYAGKKAFAVAQAWLDGQK